MNMKLAYKKIIKASLLILPVVLFASAASANETIIGSMEDESIYKYYALENKIDFSKVENRVIEEVNENINEEAVFVENTIINPSYIESLEDLARRQQISIEESEEAMNSISDKSGIQSLLLGNSLGVLKFQLVQMKDQIRSLKTLLLNADEASLMLQIKDQISALEEERIKVENFIQDRDGKFSLFGWFVASL